MAETVIKNRYELLEELGQSPFFVTWKARDRSLDGFVVLKFLRPGKAPSVEAGRDPSLGAGPNVEGFVTAMRGSGSLTAPGCARLLEADRDQNYGFMVREYVAGFPLRQKIRAQAPLPWREAVNILSLLGRIVADLHRQGGIHGHLHPRNVFISREGHLKITDAGQAAALVQAFGAGAAQFGDPAYLSPEQLRGRPPQVASDLYGLGAILYELLTGQQTLRLRSATDPLSLRGEGKAPEEGASPRNDMGPDIPPELERITRKLLERAPASRYGSAEELCQDLKRLQERTQSPAEERQPAPRPTRPRQEKAKPENPESPRISPFAWRVTRALLRALVVIVGVGLSTGMCLALVGYGAYRYWESSIPPEVVVPEVTSQSLEEAKSQMVALGLRLYVSSEQPHNKVPANHVIRTLPAGGRTVRQGRQVQAIVSTGKEIISTPNVVDRTVDRAREMLRQAGLQVGMEQEVADELTPPKFIISQSPPAGSRVEKGGKVNLVVSKGPAAKGKTEKAEPRERVAEKVHAGKVKIRVPAAPQARLQQVKIVVRDSQGERTVYDQLHLAGDVISEAVSGTGETLIEVFINGKLVRSQTL